MSKIRCAIYTRKSSEEGLEQDFNSLHAQREACAAYILSQTSEGWSLLPEDYDDGGLSGGTLERPALQRLLADINAGKIDIVVVYKVDRLTRSLLDFAKLVEALDKAGTSFVSVTQSFNTTTSMGRLTLNMLLSFAQFEREVTAERIRDKIAASKAKGMWMGGTPPLGYKPDGRTLAIVEEHAELINELFRRYLEFGNVRLLKEQLGVEGIEVPQRATSTGRSLGGVPFTRGQIYKILSNPIYLGEIHHKGQAYNGQHQAIITRPLWDQVQEMLAENLQGKQRAANVRSPSVLAGKVIDADGQALVAAHACKGKVRYRYYVSRSLQHEPGNRDGIRIPALELEGAVVARLAKQLDDPLVLLEQLEVTIDGPGLVTATEACKTLAEKVRQKNRAIIGGLVKQVEVLAHRIRIVLEPESLATKICPNHQPRASELVITAPVKLTRTGMMMRPVQPSGKGAAPKDTDRSMIELLSKARQWWKLLSDGDFSVANLSRQENVNSSWVSRIVRLNFLAPDLVASILSGTNPQR